MLGERIEPDAAVGQLDEARATIAAQSKEGPSSTARNERGQELSGVEDDIHERSIRCTLRRSSTLTPRADSSREHVNGPENGPRLPLRLVRQTAPAVKGRMFQ